LRIAILGASATAASIAAAVVAAVAAIVVPSIVVALAIGILIATVPIPRSILLAIVVLRFRALLIRRGVAATTEAGASTPAPVTIAVVPTAETTPEAAAPIPSSSPIARVGNREGVVGQDTMKKSSAEPIDKGKRQSDSDSNAQSE
jgi:hypothetical protein